jgi:hypothetical protein
MGCPQNVVDRGGLWRSGVVGIFGVGNEVFDGNLNSAIEGSLWWRWFVCLVASDRGLLDDCQMGLSARVFLVVVGGQELLIKDKRLELLPGLRGNAQWGGGHSVWTVRVSRSWHSSNEGTNRLDLSERRDRSKLSMLWWRNGRLHGRGRADEEPSAFSAESSTHETTCSVVV